jgi:hypothetical protein
MRHGLWKGDLLNKRELGNVVFIDHSKGRLLFNMMDLGVLDFLLISGSHFSLRT